MIDLAPHHLEKIRTILGKHVPECEVRAFGSRVNWTAKDYSDLDLAVVASGKLSDDTLRHLKEAFEESDLPFRVEVLDWHAISPDFQKVIEKEYEVIQGAKSEFGMAGDAEPIYGALPNHWRMASVAQLVEEGEADVQTGPFGTMLHASAYQLEGTPVVAVKNIGHNRLIHDDIPRVDDVTRRSLSRYQLQQGDILFGRKGAVERRAYVHADEDGWLQGSDCIRLRLRGVSADSRFLSLVLGSEAYRSWITQHAHGATMPSLNQEIVRRIPLPLPPPNEQRSIAHILGTLDDKIELNRRMNETLEAIARALFKSWFVDFDPVRAKAEGGDPGLPKHLAGLFPDSFEGLDTEDIPNGWRRSTLADFALLNPEVWSRETRPAVIRYIDLSNTKRGQIEEVADFLQTEAPGRAQRVLRPNDTVVGTVRPGNASYAHISEEGLTGSTGFAVLRPRKKEYAEFVYLAATAACNIQALAHIADGAAYPAVRPEVVAATPVVAGRPELFDAFAKIARPVFEGISLRQRQSRTLAALRDALLPKLISGEIRIKGTKELQGICT